MASRTSPTRKAMTFLPLLKLLFASVTHSLPFNGISILVSRRTHTPYYVMEEDPSFWIYLLFAATLVILGGAFAGLTIALMGQDEIYLQVLAASGEDAERKNAGRVLNLLKKGKHWVLVTLLLGNVITNETLPIMLDRSLGGGWQAVLGSTVLIVIFGEIVPQSVCVRYGLPIGAFMAPFVLLLMWILAPVAWPTAKLLDFLLGEDHGTTYKKAGLKTLVTLHRTLGTSSDERLNKDEVTIIRAVLDLKEKPVGSIMTPMDDAFTLSADTVLDEDMMNTILSEGYSRIPIYAVNDPENFIGMLLVKLLITYDPEDCLKVYDFQLATLPETRPETSCLDIVNFFQEGKSHMVLVSEFPGEPHGALGVVTLEDVIEELIGEEIVDESDVFIDVHKAIRRLHPVPYYRLPKSAAQDGGKEATAEGQRDSGLTKVITNTSIDRKHSGVSEHHLRFGPAPAKLMRRRSSGGTESLPVQRQDPDLRTHLQHLGPSNAAARPKQTRINTVKIKPGQDNSTSMGSKAARPESIRSPILSPSSSKPIPSAPENIPPGRTLGTENTSLLSAGHPASDAAVNYGTLSSSPTHKPKLPLEGPTRQATNEPSPLRQSEPAGSSTLIDISEASQESNASSKAIPPPLIDLRDTEMSGSASDTQGHQPSPPPIQGLPTKHIVTPESHSPALSQHGGDAESSPNAAGGMQRSASGASGGKQSVSSSGHASVGRGSFRSSSATATGTGQPNSAGIATITRTGSIMERGVDFNGVRKVVLDVRDEGGIAGEDSEVDKENTPLSRGESSMSGRADYAPEGEENAAGAKKKKRKRRGKKKKGKGGLEE